MRMVQIWETCKPLQLISPVNTHHTVFIWKSKSDLSFSKKLSRYHNSEILLSLYVNALSKPYMYIRSLQVWHRLESLFCKIAFTINWRLLFIRMCDVQYWKSNNIFYTWKIKEKLKILITCDDLSLINTTQKTLKPSQKMFQFPGWMRKKPHNREFQLKEIGGNMRCKLLQKRSTGKTTEPLNGGVHVMWD